MVPSLNYPSLTDFSNAFFKEVSENADFSRKCALMADHMESFFSFLIQDHSDLRPRPLQLGDPEKHRRKPGAGERGPVLRQGPRSSGAGRVRPSGCQGSLPVSPLPLCRLANLCPHGSSLWCSCGALPRSWYALSGAAWGSAEDGTHTASSRSSGPRCRSCVQPGKRAPPRAVTHQLGGWGGHVHTTHTGLTRPGLPLTP